MRMFLTLSEKEVELFESSREKLGMSKSQYVSYLIRGQKDIRPISIRKQKLLEVLSSIERDLKIIAMKDSLSDIDRLYVMEQLKDIKDGLVKNLK